MNKRMSALRSIPLFLFIVSLFSCVGFVVSLPSSSSSFNLAAALEDVTNHNTSVNQIIDYALTTFAGQTYNRLANFVDNAGPRLCGSEALETAVNTTLNLLSSDGLMNVHAESVQLPHWIRGNEWVTMIEPRVQDIAMLGLGNSIGTDGEVITGEILVVESYDELNKKAAQAQGKIIVFNQQCNWIAMPIDCYGISVDYRVNGAYAAAKVGGIAALVRSVTGYSLYTVHTGMTNPSPPIPIACITVEDAELFSRFQGRGQTVKLALYMEAQTLAPVTGHNVVAEIPGSVYPEQVVIVSGHLDSWDVTTGAMDDADGAIISWSALSIINQLNLRPKRTLRVVFWSCEEFGGIGSSQYFTAHKDEVPNMNVVFESDLGVFHPLGIEFTTPTHNANATLVMHAIGSLLESINATAVYGGGEGVDITPWMNAGVPGISLSSQNELYFNYHHSRADTMTVLNSKDIDLAVAVWAAHAFVLADMEQMLPR